MAAMDEDELEGRLLGLRMGLAAAIADAGAAGKVRALIESGEMEAGPTAIMLAALEELDAVLAAAELDPGKD
jgi:hypothetical protein